MDDKNGPPTKSQTINNIKKNSFASPKVTYITAANLPRIARAGKPSVKKDTTNGGLPYFTAYGIEQGLPTNRINKSLLDDKGNLWFGTPKGASRYDGKSFTNYTRANGLGVSEIWSIMQDNQGNMWFGSVNGGASKFDGKTFTVYNKAKGLAGNYVLCMMQDTNGDLWFGTDGGVSRYDGRDIKNYTTKQGLITDFVQTIVKDNKGCFWFGTNKGVCRYDGKTFVNYNDSLGLLASTSEMQCIKKDSKGNIWFSTWGQGAIKYDGNKYTKYTIADGLADNKIRYIEEDKLGNLWFGTVSGGVSKYNGKSFENYTTLQGLSDNSIRCIVEDRNGGIWFSTLGGGISKLRSLGLKYYSAIQWLPNWSILDISKDHEGNIWIGSDVGATKYDGTHFISFTEEQGMINTSRGYAGNAVTKTLQDANGDLWFSGASGVNKYDGKHFSFYSSAQGFGNNDNYVITAMQDDKGNIWFGTSTGAFKFDGKSFANYDSLQGLQGNMITDILQDSSDNIWLSSYHNGVSKYDGAKFTHYSKDQGMASNLVFCMAQDTKGGLWFGTDSGVCRYDGKKFIDYNTGSGMASNFIISIVQDTARGIIWLGTDKGLTAMKLDSVTNGPKDAYKFENFDITTGYPINGINAHTLCLDKSGSLWMGCDDNKILKFDYDQINRDTRPLNITIQGIKINNELVCWNNLLQGSQRNKKNDSSALLNEMATTFGNALSASVLDSMRKNFADVRFDSVQSFYPVPVNLSLPFNDNNISIDFVAAEPSLPKQVKYQYTLEGYDKGWSPLSNNTTAVFGNIPEGTYEFRLKALSPFGIWSETRYDFKVLPPWYRTWWAYALFGLLFIGAIWGSIYFRSKQLRRENRILEEKVNLRTHQLKEEKEKVESTLSELKSTQAQLIQSEKMASLGELTAGIAHEIQNPLNFVNNFSEVNQELVDEAELEANNGNFDEVKVIIKNIKANEEKIGHHGKRADAIVKGMLMHSRQNTSLKESTDINALADEYLRLAYHGLRAKGNPFNATIKTDFNESIGNINIIPRDIGRVFLNLYSNALYAVGEKKKQFPEEYEPTLSISTKKDEGKVAISVKDNGSGIPQKVIDKIFQPFFTTKPTGEGTGLGLSLSYDIIKTHGGEIKVNTKEGEFTEFVVLLPIIS